MNGSAIVENVANELEERARMGYDNYQYPNEGDSYSNDDSDDSESEQ